MWHVHECWYTISTTDTSLRPMVFKTVHVYDDVYAVTQSGMCVETYERKEGQLPPKLAAEKPLVAPSPTLKYPLSELYKQSAIY